VLCLGKYFRGSSAGVVHSFKGSFGLNFLLQIDTLGVSPGHVIANRLKALVVDVSLHFWHVLGDHCLDLLVKRSLHGISLRLPLGAVDVVETQSVIVLPTVHLDGEDSGLVREGFESHFVNPGFEVEAFDWWHGVILLVFLKNIVILGGRVKTQHHCLGAEDSGVIPAGLHKRLLDVVNGIQESRGLLHVSVPQLVANHVLLSNAERGQGAHLRRLFSFGFCPAQGLGRSVGAVGADLEDVLD